MRTIHSTQLILNLVLFAAGLYILILVLFYFFHDSFIFNRTTLDKNYKFTFNQTFEEYFIENDEATINALHFKGPKPSKGLIFYLHGNSDDLSRWGNYAIDFTSLGYDVFMFDYRGYGKSTGKPSQKNLHQDASFVLHWAKANLPVSNFIIYGRSLGSALATKLAGSEQPHLLILETPFAQLSDAIYWPLKPALYFFKDEVNFNNIDLLKKVKCKKVIFHGTTDWVIPLSSAEKLKPLLDSPNDFILVEGGGHRNLRDFDIYHSKLAEILK